MGIFVRLDPFHFNLEVLVVLVPGQPECANFLDDLWGAPNGDDGQDGWRPPLGRVLNERCKTLIHGASVEGEYRASNRGCA